MRYFVFIDETGEANINNLDPRYNAFTLCAVIFNEHEYASFNEEMKRIKRKIFNDENIVFHSYCMRKQRGRFSIFKDESVLRAFYKEIEIAFRGYQYTLFSCVVDKNRYKLKYPNRNTAYEESLMFICERLAFYFKGAREGNVVHLILESRGKGKDRLIKKHYGNFITNGTGILAKENFSMCHPRLEFRKKEDCVNGLEFSDLCAFPITRKALHPNRPQPTYDLIEDRIYCSPFGDTIGYGIKHFP